MRGITCLVGMLAALSVSCSDDSGGSVSDMDGGTDTDSEASTDSDSDTDADSDSDTDADSDSDTDTDTDSDTDADVDSDTFAPMSTCASGEGAYDPNSGLCWQNPIAYFQLTWTHAIDYCDWLTFGGFHEWRAPTVGEMRSLIRACPATVIGGSCDVYDDCLSADCYSGWCSSGCPFDEGPGQEGCYQDPDLDCIQQGFWSSSTFASDDELGWYVGLGTATIFPLENTYKNTVRCVRNGDTPDVDTDSDTYPELSSCADGLGIYDPSTDLCWQDSYSEESMPWADALAYCGALSFGGLDGWRVPTVDEARTAIRGCYPTETGGSCPYTDECTEDCGDSTCTGCDGAEGPGVGGCYLDEAFDSGCDVGVWTATAFWSDDIAALRLGYWYAGIEPTDKTTSIHVRCVRNGL